MKLEEVKTLHGLTEHELSSGRFLYRYNYALQTGVTVKKYPVCIISSPKNPRYRIYDYSETSSMILNKSSYLTYVDLGYNFETSSSHTKYYFIDEITFEQAQEIITKNIQLFAKINERVQQDLLLAKLLQN